VSWNELLLCCRDEGKLPSRHSLLISSRPISCSRVCLSSFDTPASSLIVGANPRKLAPRLFAACRRQGYQPVPSATEHCKCFCAQQRHEAHLSQAFWPKDHQCNYPYQQRFRCTNTKYRGHRHLWRGRVSDCWLQQQIRSMSMSRTCLRPGQFEPSEALCQGAGALAADNSSSIYAWILLGCVAADFTLKADLHRHFEASLCPKYELLLGNR